MVRALEFKTITRDSDCCRDDGAIPFIAPIVKQNFEASSILIDERMQKIRLLLNCFEFLVCFGFEMKIDAFSFNWHVELHFKMLNFASLSFIVIKHPIFVFLFGYVLSHARRGFQLPKFATVNTGSGSVGLREIIKHYE